MKADYKRAHYLVALAATEISATRGADQTRSATVVMLVAEGLALRAARLEREAAERAALAAEVGP